MRQIFPNIVQNLFHNIIKLKSFFFSLQAVSNDTKIIIDHSLQHHNRLYNANKGIDEVIGSGSSILANLKEQRLSLKVGRCFLRQGQGAIPSNLIHGLQNVASRIQCQTFINRIFARTCTQCSCFLYNIFQNKYFNYEFARRTIQSQIFQNSNEIGLMKKRKKAKFSIVCLMILIA